MMKGWVDEEPLGLEVIETKYHIETVTVKWLGKVVVFFRFASQHHPPIMPRSSDYGSPQCRKRIYILGARPDMVDVAQFRAAVHFFVNTLPSFHHRASIHELVAWLEECNNYCDVPRVPCQPKDIQGVAVVRNAILWF